MWVTRYATRISPVTAMTAFLPTDESQNAGSDSSVPGHASTTA